MLSTSCNTSSVMLSCMMQEKEQALISACKQGDMDEAKRLVGSGVSVKCRDQVCSLSILFVILFCFTDKLRC